MAAKEGDGLDGFLFSESAELVDFRCFRGDREDISEQDVRDQIHSAFMQRKMKRAKISSASPVSDVERVDAKEFVAGLARTC